MGNRSCKFVKWVSEMKNGRENFGWLTAVSAFLPLPSSLLGNTAVPHHLFPQLPVLAG